jgi:hypothetical protein
MASRKWVLAAAGWAAATAAGAPAYAAPGFVSHRAAYELKLVEGAGTKAPASASGIIAFDFDAACAGYVQTLRQAIDIQPQEGARRLTESRTTTFESRDGGEFRFNILSSGDTTEGHAERNAKGVEIALSRPRPHHFSGGDALFPTEHLAKVLTAAQKGEKILLARVYDGTDDGEKIFDVTAVIGAVDAKPDPDRAAIDPALLGLKRWPVALSYFAHDNRDGTPEYILAFNLYENGVSTGLRLDYGQFVLTGELTKIEFRPPAKCGK